MAVQQDEIEDIVETSREKHRAGHAYERALQIAMRDPSDAFDLTSSLLLALPEGPVLFDAVISYVPNSYLGGLVRAAIERLESSDSGLRKSGAAAAVISYTSLQAPSLLASHLADIWRLRPNTGTYYEMWPWRGASAGEARELLAICTDRKASAADRVRAWRGLLETRLPEILGHAVAAANTVEADLPGSVLANLHQVGYDLTNGTSFRRMTPDSVFHLRFPAGYFRDSARPVWIRRSTHPSWRSTSPAFGTARVGGVTDATCAICGRQLMPLIEIESGLEELGVASLRRLQIVLCDFCASYSTAVFYSHDPSGSPASLPGDKPVGVHEWDPVSLLPVNADVVETSARWRLQDWALSNDRENLYRLGGEPTWIQSAEFPLCPQCGVRMPFLMQFDSEAPNSTGGEWSCGAGSGIVYVFWCDSCAISGASIQDT